MIYYSRIHLRGKLFVRNFKPKHASIVDDRKAVLKEDEGEKSTSSKDHLILPSIVLREPQREQMALVLLKLMKKMEKSRSTIMAVNTQSNEALIICFCEHILVHFKRRCDNV